MSPSELVNQHMLLLSLETIRIYLGLLVLQVAYIYIIMLLFSCSKQQHVANLFQLTLFCHDVHIFTFFMKIKDYDDVLDLELDSMDKFVLQCLAFYQVCNFPPFDPFSVELVLCFRSQNMYLCDKFQSHLRTCRNNCFLSMLHY